MFYFGSSWPEDLVRTENGFGKAARLEQGEAQQDSIADTRPDGVHHIAANGDALHQNRIDRHAYQNQHTLKANGQQGLEIVGAHAAKLPVDAGGNWDRCKARQK